MTRITTFHLALHRGASAQWWTLDEVARRLEEGEPVDVPPAGTTLNIVAGGVEQLAGRRSFGPLTRLLPQLDPAAERLAAGCPALVRSAVEDVPAGLYVALEPIPDSDDATVRLRELEELPHAGWFPDDSIDVEDLVRVVLDRSRPAEVEGQHSWVAPRRWLVAALHHEADVGRRVVEAMGVREP